MKPLKNNKGLALITALMLTLISLTMILALMYIVSQNISASGSQKRYQSSLDAAQGGVDIISRDIIPRLLRGDAVSDITSQYNTFLTNNALVISSSSCMNDKLRKTSKNWTNCGTGATDIDAKTGFDISLTLKNVQSSQPGYTIYSKIIDTSPGNSDTTGIDYLDDGSSTTNASNGTIPKHVPYMYQIEVQGESAANAKERAKLSVLYAY